MTRRSPKPLRKRIRSLYSWHRWLGVLSALFVIWLSVTGIALEHTEQLNLANTSFSSTWLQKRLGVEITPPDEGIRFQDHWLSQVDGRLYLNTHPVGPGAAPVGLTRLGVFWIVASRERLWLLNNDAEVLEKLEGLDLPGRLISVGNINGALVVKTRYGHFSADPLAANWPEWQPSTFSFIPNYESAPLPSAIQQSVVAQARDHALNWEQILIEAHSGRILGPYGVWLMDIMAISFIILAITGLSLWLRYRRARRKRLIKLQGR